MNKYLVDSNILISPHRTFYQFVLVPSFWLWFIKTYDLSIFLVDKVRDEICTSKEDNKKDLLQLWVESNCLDKEKYSCPMLIG